MFRRVFAFLMLIMVGLSGFGAMARTEEPEAWQVFLEEEYQRLLPDAGVRMEEWEAALDACASEEEKTVMKYYFTCMPMADLCELDFDLLRSYASHAVRLREEMPWTAELDFDVFLAYVAAYRVDFEPIVEHRAFFHDQIVGSGILEGKTLEEAALAVNLWCASRVTFENTDQKVASPMGMYNGGLGRCGEEANFVVNALRSVGIPARLVSVYWAESGDHAFVEVLVDGQWRFLSACEPEAMLNHTWFKDLTANVLSTSILTYSLIGTTEAYYGGDGMYILNDVENYADARQVTFTVLDAQGDPAENCYVGLYQYGDYMYKNLAELYTDGQGVAQWTLGRGTAIAIAVLDGQTRQQVVTLDADAVLLDFSSPEPRGEWQETELVYNDAVSRYDQQPTEAQTEAFLEGRDLEALRQSHVAELYDAEAAAAYPQCADALRLAGRNFPELMAFLSVDDDPLRQELLSRMEAKDLREVDATVLEDILQGAKAAQGEYADTDEAFLEGTLTPVYDRSPLSAYRLELQDMMTDAGLELDAVRKEPALLDAWLRERLSGESVRRCDIYGADPVSALRMGYCAEANYLSTLARVAQAAGIPVRQDAATGQWMWYDGANWSAMPPLSEESGDTGVLLYAVEGSEAWLGQYWMLYQLQGQQWTEMFYWYVAEQDADEAIELPAGEYQIVMFIPGDEETNSRLYQNYISIEAGETVTVSLP